MATLHAKRCSCGARMIEMQGLTFACMHCDRLCTADRCDKCKSLSKAAK